MRELPEFQVLAHNLNTFFKKRVLLQLQIINFKKIKHKQEDFDFLKGSILQSIFRYGKELRLEFKSALLGIDLMQHGNLLVFDKVNENKFTVAELQFDNGKGLALTDWQENAIIKINPEENSGIDALSETLYDYLLTALQTKAKLKSFITNQKLIRGIGNVYADEIMWEARVSPFSIASAIPEFKIKSLALAVKKVLTNAEKKLKAKKIFQLNGNEHEFLKIYGKAGEKSPTGSLIKVDKKAGHSTYYTDEQVLYK